MSGRLTIEVGLPHPCLNPNKSKSTHWAKLGAERKKLRDAVYNTIRFLNPQFVDARWESATIRYDFYHECVRKRDDDNFRAMMKSARDAFGPPHNTGRGRVRPGASVVIDDNVIDDTQPVGFYIDEGNPRVRITLTRTA